MRTLLAALAVSLVVLACRSARTAESIVGQVHVVSIHVPDHPAFDSVFLLLRDVLQLPRVYGEVSKPSDAGQRLYAGFSVGNAYLEPCGPYATDAPFDPDRRARFHGLTFSPGRSLVEAAKELDRRAIAHSEIMGNGDLPRFVYLSDAVLTGKLLSAGIWEIQNTNDHTNLPFLASSLRDRKGGALGAKRLREVRLGCADGEAQSRWSKLLAPARTEGGVWHVRNGPAIRLVPFKANQIESLVFEVESLGKAKSILDREHLLGESKEKGLELDTTKTLGLRIILMEE